MSVATADVGTLVIELTFASEYAAHDLLRRCLVCLADGEQMLALQLPRHASRGVLGMTVKMTARWVLPGFCLYCAWALPHAQLLAIFDVSESGNSVLLVHLRPNGSSSSMHTECISLFLNKEDSNSTLLMHLHLSRHIFCCTYRSERASELVALKHTFASASQCIHCALMHMRICSIQSKLMLFAFLPSCEGATAKTFMLC